MRTALVTLLIAIAMGGCGGPHHAESGLACLEVWPQAFVEAEVDLEFVGVEGAGAACFYTSGTDQVLQLHSISETEHSFQVDTVKYTAPSAAEAGVTLAGLDICKSAISLTWGESVVVEGNTGGVTFSAFFDNIDRTEALDSGTRLISAACSG